MVIFWKGNAKKKDLTVNYNDKGGGQSSTWFNFNYPRICLAAAVIIILLLIHFAGGMPDIYPRVPGFQDGDNLFSGLSFYSGNEYYPDESGNLLNSYSEVYSKYPGYSVSSGETGVLTITITPTEMTLSIFLYLILIIIMPVTFMISFIAVIFGSWNRRGIHD
ncbi:hypothetical protein [Methanoplanus limicola]|uniref:Uncharacterized protein n=1 Tax=Methanoplanus limicola DSM 2279 TaxID=937775 RepID=H1YZP8_9EURY|nr:hypothetical protein [Methanoplanus limicola]EHQ34310.1 hypothetical protein Metlim_0157 [Methanoplanus limicola DSM 2279]